MSDGATVTFRVFGPGGMTGMWLGIAIHMLLAVALGCAFAHALWRPLARPRGPAATLGLAALTLASVWTMNFFVVLPVLNPVFITLIPYPVSFASKMLFALAMAVTLVWPELRLARERRHPARFAG